MPPTTGRSCTNAVFTPLRAADSAVHIPAMPPPHITNSYSSVVCCTFWRESSKLVISCAPQGNSMFLSMVNTIMPQRPSKPVKSCSRTSQMPLSSDTTPAYSKPHCAVLTPSRSGSSIPFTAMVKQPASISLCHGATQL